MISFTVPKTDVKVLSDGLYAKMVNSRVVIALPERLYCKDTQKMLNVLLLVLPKIIDKAFEKMKNSWYEPVIGKITEQGQSIEVLKYRLKTGEDVIVMPIKDDVNGIYSLEIWGE